MATIRDYAGDPEHPIGTVTTVDFVQIRRDEYDRLRAVNAELLRALLLVLGDYRTEGCQDLDCIVCRRSRAAVSAARAAIAKATEVTP